MKLLRWIFGIPLASAICLAIIVFLSQISSLNNYAYSYNNEMQNFLLHSLIVVFCFALFVFLCCLFVPNHKKYAMLASVLIIVILRSVITFITFSNRMAYGDVSIGAWVCTVAGVSLGAYVSYEVFKNKKWHSPKNSDDDRLLTY